MLSVYFHAISSQFYRFKCIWMDFDEKCRKTNSATQTASFIILENFVFCLNFCTKTPKSTLIFVLVKNCSFPVVNTHFCTDQKLFNPRSQHSFSTPVVKGLKKENSKIRGSKIMFVMFKKYFLFNLRSVFSHMHKNLKKIPRVESFIVIKEEYFIMISFKFCTSLS